MNRTIHLPLTEKLSACARQVDIVLSSDESRAIQYAG